jgi:hypothetical protein
MTYKEINNIMKMWHHLLKPGEYWRFSRLTENDDDFNEPIALANTVFTALWPVVQPLSVTIEMEARSREFPVIEYEIPLPVSTWHLREVDVPAHIAVVARVERLGKHSEETISRLTPQALADWLARANAQQLVEGYVPVLHILHMYYTRARLLEYEQPSAELAWGSQTYAIPVEKREDGLWVSGPMRDTMIEPPIKIELANFHGRLGLDIWVCWSPWIEAGSAEAKLLRTCLRELEKQGWESGKQTTDWLRRT